MILTYEEEQQRADTANRPFANSTEGNAWVSTWCNTCLRERNCPLIDLVIIDGVTPFGWVPRDRADLGFQYVCTEYVSVAPPTEPEK